MEAPHLTLFPDGLTSSVVTTVWVGVWVIAFFNLRFGWVLSGLVVPGYLVPLLIMKPWAASVVVAEAMVTYAIVSAFSERLSGPARWSGLFGRDRFMALVLASVAVRLTFDSWLLPIVGASVNDWFGIAFDWRSNLHSFGLIVISLLANQFWKPGLKRGMATMGVSLLITWLIVRYGLMEFTNFRMSGISYLYEGYAASILASPKAYIILIVTAILASRMNLRHGWEFGGILIPALIALQWYEPVKVAASFVEAFVILGAGSLLLRLPIFADVTMEGARKILLFFNIAFVWRLTLGWGVTLSGVEMRVSDIYGFGYLLSTLMAIKMHDKGMVARFTRSTLQVSLLGAGAGTALGFAMIVAPEALGRDPAAGGPARSSEVLRTEAPLPRVMAPEAVAALGRPGGAERPTPALREIAAFEAGLEALAGGPATSRRLGEAAGYLAAAGYDLTVAEARWLVLRDRRGERAGGTFALALAGRGPLLVTLPDPAAVPALPLAAMSVVESQNAGAFAMPGVAPGALAEGVQAPEPGPFHRAFLATFGGGQTLAIAGAEGGGARLEVAGTLPKGIDTAALEAMLPALSVSFDAPGGPGAPEATLVLDRAAVRAHLAGGRRVAEISPGRPVGAQLLRRMSEPEALARPGIDRYDPPGLGALRHLDEAVLAPVMREALAPGPQGPDPAVLTAADRAAEVMGYAVSIHRHEGVAHAVIAEDPAAPSPRRHWGAYAVRIGEAAPWLVGAPRPVSELDTLDYAAGFADRHGARALFIAGADPAFGLAPEADVTDPDAPPSLFGLAHEALFDALGAAPVTVVQMRALGVPDEGGLPSADVLLALSETPVAGLPKNGPAARLRGLLRAEGLSVALVEGEAESAGYGVGYGAQALSASRSPNKTFAALWLSPLTRAAAAERRDAGLETAQFAALGIPTRERAPAEQIGAAPPSGQRLPEGFREALAPYLDRRDILGLAHARAGFEDLELARLLTPGGQSLLSVEARGATLALVKLNPLDPDGVRRLAPAFATPEAVRDWTATPAAWLLFEEGGP